MQLEAARARSFSLMNGAKSVLSAAGALRISHYIYQPRETYQFRQQASLADFLGLKKREMLPRRWKLSSFTLNVIEMREMADKFCARPLRGNGLSPLEILYRRPRTQHAQYNHHWYIDFAAISQVETTLFAPFFWHALLHAKIHIIVHFSSQLAGDKTLLAKCLQAL
jgi:hypothetical protein